MPTLPNSAGRLRLYTIPNSTAGAPLVYNVPDGVRWRLICFRSIVTTDVNAANRRIIFALSKHTYYMVTTIAQYTIPASQSPLIQFTSDGRDSTGEITDRHITRLPMPLYLDDHCGLLVDIDAIQVGDQFTFNGLLVEEWLEQCSSP